MNIDILSAVLGFIGGLAIAAIAYFAYSMGQKSSKGGEKKP